MVQVLSGFSAARGQEGPRKSMNDYRNSLRTAVGASAAPYGYTLTTWTTGAVLTHASGVPGALDALLFMAGAVLGFALVGVLAFGSVRQTMAHETRRAALWGSFHFLSVGSAIGAASVAAWMLHGQLLWCVGSFLSTTTYLLVLALQFTMTSSRDQ